MKPTATRVWGPSARSRRRTWAAIGLPVLLCIGGCGARTQAAPQAGYERGGVPEFAGARVIVLPLQRHADESADLDRELEYALTQLAGEVGWVFPADLRAAIDRNPGAGLQIDALPVQGFLSAEIQRVGDPLFGSLYRLGAFANASYALLPVEARANQGDQGVSLELSAALLELRGGNVLWFGIVEGSWGSTGTPFLSATLAEALARRIVSR